MGLLFTIAASSRERSHSQVRVSRDSWPHFRVSGSRLPQPGGLGPRIYIPQEQDGPIIPPGTGFPFPFPFSRVIQNLVRTSQKTYYISTTETNRLMLWNYTKHADTLWEQNAEFQNVKVSGRYSNHWVTIFQVVPSLQTSIILLILFTNVFNEPGLSPDNPSSKFYVHFSLLIFQRVWQSPRSCVTCRSY
jgi:hypothetical protein